MARRARAARSGGAERSLAEQLEQAERILGGDIQPEAHQLFELIHAVNPSKRAVPERERRAGYALKQRLQSLLIGRFPEAIEVMQVPGRPGLVSLRHRFVSRDACHCVVADLEAPARYWVESELARQ